MARMIKKRKQARRPKRQFFKKRKCAFCTEKTEKIDYKDVAKLTRFISERGKIVPRRASSVCARHQRRLACAIKRARFIALLPFVRK